MADGISGAPDGFAQVREIEARAQRFETPCGSGNMVWHKWGQGSPLLLLHGGSGSWYHWLRQIPALESKFTVWVPDLPGMGDSAIPPEPFEAGPYAEIVESGFEALAGNPESFDLAGFSFGAGLAGRVACRMTGRVRRMVLSGANFYQPLPMTRRANLMNLKRIEDPAERLKAVRNNLQVMMVKHERNVDDLAVHLYDIDTRRRRLPRVKFSGFPTLRVDLGQMSITGRLCAISGADDQIIGHDAAGQAGELRSIRPDAQYHAVAGAGHWVMYEGAQGYNQALLAALAD